MKIVIGKIKQFIHPGLGYMVYSSFSLWLYFQESVQKMYLNSGLRMKIVYYIMSGQMELGKKKEKMIL